MYLAGRKIAEASGSFAVGEDRFVSGARSVVVAEKLDSRTKTFVSRRLRCCVRCRERAGLAGPRSAQDTIHAALKEPLFHGNRCFRSTRRPNTEAVVQRNQSFRDLLWPCLRIRGIDGRAARRNRMEAGHSCVGGRVDQVKQINGRAEAAALTRTRPSNAPLPGILKFLSRFEFAGVHRR
jgi:hypothetical protein